MPSSGRRRCWRRAGATRARRPDKCVSFPHSAIEGLFPTLARRRAVRHKMARMTRPAAVPRRSLLLGGLAALLAWRNGALATDDGGEAASRRADVASPAG